MLLPISLQMKALICYSLLMLLLSTTWVSSKELHSKGSKALVRQRQRQLQRHRQQQQQHQQDEGVLLLQDEGVLNRPIDNFSNEDNLDDDDDENGAGASDEDAAAGTGSVMDSDSDSDGIGDGDGDHIFGKFLDELSIDMNAGQMTPGNWANSAAAAAADVLDADSNYQDGGIFRRDKLNFFQQSGNKPNNHASNGSGGVGDSSPKGKIFNSLSAAGAAGANTALVTDPAAGGVVGGGGGNIGSGGVVVGIGGTLDEFVGGKLGASETAGVTLPYFLSEPQSVFVVKNRPAILKCKAAHALQLHFKCSGSSQPPPSTHDKHVDPHTGVHLEEVTATIHRDLIDEYFGKGPFKCECHAWSSRGVVKSQAATITTAYIRKQFVTSPTSLRVELGSRAELFCEPPNGFPEPTVVWHKNNQPIVSSNEHGPQISPTNTLTFRQVTLQDMANYTCVAENIAGKRNSDSAVLIVYVNGGWSPWGSWRDCKCAGKVSQGRKRSRTCNNPMAMNGGAECSGVQIQKSADCLPCSDETQIVNTESFEAPVIKRAGRWSAWSEWSSCSSDCIQIRRRKCILNTAAAAISQLTDDYDEDAGAGADANAALAAIAAAAATSNANNALANGIGGNGIGSTVNGAPAVAASPGLGGIAVINAKVQCNGKDIQTAECRGEHCLLGKDDFDWTLYLGLAFITAVFFAFGAALICCARRGLRLNQHYGMSRTVMEPKYLPDINKKDMHVHIETINDNYDYASPGQRFLPPTNNLNHHHHNHHHHNHHRTCSITEHHYDVPNLSSNYINPIDDLSINYLTDTPDTSTVDTSNSTYEVNNTNKLNTAMSSNPNSSKSSIYEQVNSSGGSLSLYGGEIMLYIPEHSLGKGVRKNISLMLLQDEMSRLILSTTNDGSIIVTSCMVFCGPSNYTFQKPVILKIPHCLISPDLWNVSIYYTDQEPNDLSAVGNWRQIITVGQETLNTPIFVQLERHHVYIMTEQLGRFVVAAEPKIPSNALEQNSLKMRLLAFSQFTPANTNCSLRIYIVKDFPNSRDICSSIEYKLGGTFIGQSQPFAFKLNSNSMSIRLRNASNASTKSNSAANNNMLNNEHLWDSGDEDLLLSQQQIIPYNHILANNSLLHCEFNIKRSHMFYSAAKMQIDFAQCNDDISLENDVNSFAVCWRTELSNALLVNTTNSYTGSSSNCHPTVAEGCSPYASLERCQTTTVTIDNYGNYINDTNVPLNSVHLPHETKRRICAALDPPRQDERDWRLLAKKLQTDHYIAYFAIKSSPTEQILNLWECRRIQQQHSSTAAQTVVELLMILKEMERTDVVDIITETIGSLWI